MVLKFEGVSHWVSICLKHDALNTNKETFVFWVVCQCCLSQELHHIVLGRVCHRHHSQHDPSAVAMNFEIVYTDGAQMNWMYVQLKVLTGVPCVVPL